MSHFITETELKSYTACLREEEKSEKTIQKYMHELKEFALWLGEEAVSKDAVTKWKAQLLAKGKSAVTVNGSLAALHGFFSFMGWHECKVKYLKVQRQMFRDASRELTKGEYQRLVQTAEGQGNLRLALLLETICATGVRVSEVRYITVEAARRGKTEIALKGKIRTILIPSKLAKKLMKYAKKEKIAFGEIFITKSGKSISRRQIWGEMKRLCRLARVDETKVFPHNLRHLFARLYYQACRDIVRLADVLGHSSVETTRIYLITTSKEHSRCLDRLGLVS